MFENVSKKQTPSVQVPSDASGELQHPDTEPQTQVPGKKKDTAPFQGQIATAPPRPTASVEDIFVHTDKSLIGPAADLGVKVATSSSGINDGRSSPFKPVAHDTDLPEETAETSTKQPIPPDKKELSAFASRFESSKRRYFIIGIIGLGVLVVGAFVYWIVVLNSTPLTSTSSSQTTLDQLQTESRESQSVKKSESTIPSSRTENSEAQVVQKKDSDLDGLTDEEELLLGTSPQAVDTDNDGLFDRDEVKVYLTDPLNADSDNDGYLDGEEIINGYNPRGSGKLIP